MKQALARVAAARGWMNGSFYWVMGAIGLVFLVVAGEAVAIGVAHQEARLQQRRIGAIEDLITQLKVQEVANSLRIDDLQEHDSKSARRAVALDKRILRNLADDRAARRDLARACAPSVARDRGRAVSAGRRHN